MEATRRGKVGMNLAPSLRFDRGTILAGLQTVYALCSEVRVGREETHNIPSSNG